MSGNPDLIRRKLIELLEDFEERLRDDDLRHQVKALVPAVYLLRDLGSSLVPRDDARSARQRILYYLQRYPFTVISGDELAVVSGISEYARRVRELRVQKGWPIYSGRTMQEILEDELLNHASDVFGDGVADKTIRSMKPDDYILVGEQDRDAAHRWHVANEIRRGGTSIQDRLLAYLRENVGKPVTGEELRYVADAQSWPRRTRELRTEEGWPLARISHQT